MSTRWVTRYWAQTSPADRQIAFFILLGIILGGLAGYTILHKRIMAKAASEAARVSVLVLPFTPLSGDAGLDDITDAITADTISSLARIKDSVVIARGTAFYYKGQAIDVQSVAGHLNVRYVLRGEVARAGADINLTAQWVDGATGALLSTAQFDSDLGKIAELGPAIAARLAMDLNLPLATTDRAKPRGGMNPAAVELTLRGRARLNQSITKDTLLAAQRDFTDALALAPDEEQALAGRGQVLSELAHIYPDSETAQRLVSSAQDLARGMAIDPNDPIALNAAARIDGLQGRLEKALLTNQRAIDLDPSFASALADQASLLILSGKNPPALKMIDQALKLSPGDPDLAEFFYIKCSALIRFHEYSQAVTFCAKSVALRPDPANVSALVVSYMIIGDLDHMRRTKELLLRIKPDFTVHESLQMLDAQSENPDYRKGSERFTFYLKQAGLPE